MGIVEDISQKTILFICSGNIIRSSFAELYGRFIGINRDLLSAGTTYYNSRLHKKTRESLLSLGIPELWLDEFKPTHISDISLSEDMLIIGMTSDHLKSVPKIFSNPRYLLSEVEGKKYDIDDPYFTGKYEEVFQNIRKLIERLALLINN